MHVLHTHTHRHLLISIFVVCWFSSLKIISPFLWKFGCVFWFLDNIFPSENPHQIPHNHHHHHHHPGECVFAFCWNPSIKTSIHQSQHPSIYGCCQHTFDWQSFFFWYQIWFIMSILRLWLFLFIFLYDFWLNVCLFVWFVMSKMKNENKFNHIRWKFIFFCCFYCCFCCKCQDQCRWWWW